MCGGRGGGGADWSVEEEQKKKLNAKRPKDGLMLAGFRGRAKKENSGWRTGEAMTGEAMSAQSSCRPQTAGEDRAGAPDWSQPGPRSARPGPGLGPGPGCLAVV